MSSLFRRLPRGTRAASTPQFFLHSYSGLRAAGASGISDLDIWSTLPFSAAPPDVAQPMRSQYRPVAPVGGASPSAYHSRREVLDWRRQHRSGGSLPGSRDGVAPRQPLQPRLRDPVDPVLLGQHARRRVSTRRRTMRLSRSLRPVSPAPGLGLDLERSGGAPGRNRTCCLMLRRHSLILPTGWKPNLN